MVLIGEWNQKINMIIMSKLLNNQESVGCEANFFLLRIAVRTGLFESLSVHNLFKVTADVLKNNLREVSLSLCIRQLVVS